MNNAMWRTGWTVTLAGTYGEDMAPDVEMRLSFPKKSPPPSSANFNKVYKFPSHQKYFNDSLSHRDNCAYGNGNGTNQAAILPPPNGNYNNPKRSLSRNVIDGMDSSLHFSISESHDSSQSLSLSLSLERFKANLDLCELWT